MKFSAVFTFLILAVLLFFASGVSAVAPVNPSGRMVSCQARQAAVKSRIMRLADFSGNMGEKFSMIAAKVEEYYENTLVPQGKKLDNYSSLVQDISDNKAKVQNSLDSARMVGEKFNCEGNNPKTLLTDFRLKMRMVKDDLKAYRTAIRNLVVAVRSLR